MNTGHRIMMAMIICIAIITPTYAAQQMPPGSYLKQRAATVSDLVKQVSTDQQVKMRYARHFGINPDEVSKRFGSDLKLVTLKAPLKAEVWYISTNGKQHKKFKTLPKGTVIFASKDGKPILMWKCGNPVRTKLPEPKPVAAAAPGAAVATAVQTASEQPVETKVLAAPIETITAAAITAVPSVMVEAAAIEPIAVVPLLDTSFIPLPPAISSGSSLGWLGALGGAAGAAMAASSSSEPTRAVVPEPSVIASLGAGLAALTAMGAVKRRKRM